MIRDGVLYRDAKVGDLDALVELDARKWDEDTLAEKDKWESRLKIFPEGVSVAVDDGRIVGVSVSHIVDYPSDGSFPSWEEITANGYITNHDPNGNKFYGVNLAVDSDKRRVAYNLHEYCVEKVTRPRGLPWRVGYRAPFVAEYQKKYGAISEDKVLGMAMRDPIVNNIHFKIGFELIGVARDYFAQDKESAGWGVILEVR